MSLTQEVDLTIPIRTRLPEQGVWLQLNCMSLSDEEQAFLLEHLEEPAHVALDGWDKSIPHNPEEVHGPTQSVNEWCEEHPGIVPLAMKKILDRFQEVRDTRPESFGYYVRDSRVAPLIGKKPEEEFRGNDAVRACLEDTIEYSRRFAKIRETDPGAALHPSLFTRDGRGKLHFQGVGSDRGVVRWLTFWILHEDTGKVLPDWAAAAASDLLVAADAAEAEKVTGLGSKFELIEGPNFYECPVKGCNKRMEFNADSAGARNAARVRMSKHMTMVKTNVDDHREAKVVIFGS